MPKSLTFVGMIVSSLVIILFGADLAIGFPFQKASITMDVIYLLCAGMLGYMSWNSFREQK